MKRMVEVCTIVLALSLSIASAQQLDVPGTYASIQAAIEDASHGDVVLVQPGLYIEQVNFRGKNITVTSIDPNDPSIVEATVIDGDAEFTPVIFNGGETHAAVLTGFTITNGYGTEDPEFMETNVLWGAAIYIKNASPTITRNFFTENNGPLLLDPASGKVCYGGIGSLSSDAVITNNTFNDNAMFAGGAIMTYMGNPLIANNIMHHNSAVYGGAVVLFGGRLHNNTIVANDLGVATLVGEEGLGGNIYVSNESEFTPSEVKGNIIALAPEGGGVLNFGLPDESLTHNNVWGNSPGNYLGVDPSTGQEVYDGPADKTGIFGNISEPPLFVNEGVHDYHLMPDSPCINTGDPGYIAADGETDIDGDPRIYAVIIDIGADEFTGSIAPVADAGPDRHLAEPGEVQLDGTDSFFYDPCEEPTFLWEQIDGPAVDLLDFETPNPSFTASEYGVYEFELVVSDGESYSRPDEVSIYIGNEAPVADAGPNQVSGIPAYISLDGSDSYDPDPIDEIAYTWTQIAGPNIVLTNADSPRPSFLCEDDGLYGFELVVSDPFVDSAPSRVWINTIRISLDFETFELDLQSEQYQHYPDISGNAIVCAMGWFEDYDWDIAHLDMDSGEVTILPSPGIDTHPKVDGDVIVWSGGATRPFGGYVGPVNLSVFAHNIRTGQKITLAEQTDFDSYSHPAISGNKVVWIEHFGVDRNNEIRWAEAPYNIVGADISDMDNPVGFFIAEEVGERDPYNYVSPAYDIDSIVDISGDIVVWEGFGDIFGADISDLSDIRVFTICQAPGMQTNPAISGGIVVWVDQRDDGGDIYAADISDLDNIVEIPLVVRSGFQTQPAVDGCIVTYIEGGTNEGWINAVCLTGDNTPIEVALG